MKRHLLFSILILHIFMFCSCGQSIKEESKQTDSLDSMETSVEEETFELVSGEYRLDFTKGENGFGVFVVDTAAEDEVMFANEMPAMIVVRREEEKGDRNFESAAG